MNRRKREFALYHDDEFIAIGTVEELAKLRNISYESLMWYKRPIWKKRSKGKSYILIELEDEDYGIKKIRKRKDSSRTN